MKVSILIPVYKVEKYIERCARSVFEQTFGDLEIIFVDDCSPDNSITILKRVLEDYPDRKKQTRIIRHKKNEGLSGARNTAIKAATGDYIYFLDSDDEISKDCIQELIGPLKKTHYDFVIGDYAPSGFSEPKPKLRLEEGGYFDDFILKSYCNKDWYMMAVNKLVNRDFIIKKKLWFYPGIIHEDDLWSFQLACVAKSMYVHKVKTMTYFMNEASIMTSCPIQRKVQSSITILKEIRKALVKQEIFKTLRERPQFLKYHIQNCYLQLIIGNRSDFPQIKEIDNLFKKIDEKNYYYLPKEQTYFKLHYIESFRKNEFGFQLMAARTIYKIRELWQRLR